MARLSSNSFAPEQRDEKPVVDFDMDLDPEQGPGPVKGKGRAVSATPRQEVPRPARQFVPELSDEEEPMSDNAGASGSQEEEEDGETTEAATQSGQGSRSGRRPFDMHQTAEEKRGLKEKLRSKTEEGKREFMPSSRPVLELK